MKKETQVKIIKSIYFIVGALLGVVSLLFALEAVGITESLRATTPIWILTMKVYFYFGLLILD